MSEISTKPYLVRAIYQWCTDQGLTPYIAVAVDRHTMVPRQFVQEGQIVLNISPDSTQSLVIGNEVTAFQARFGGVAQNISARELYRAVIAQTDNPEFMAALADLEDAADNTSIAATERDNARAGYRGLLARHRAAYAQQAAEFMLGIGENDEALALARENIELRQDIGSLILLARSAEAAGEHGEACAAAARAQATGLKPPELAEIAPLSLSCSAR